MLAVNLGGEGEFPGVLNQQPPWALNPGWRSTTLGNPGKTIRELEAEGHQFIIAPNDQLPFADESVDVVYTNGVPIDVLTHLGPGVQSSEIRRILNPGRIWIDDRRVRYRKP
ncbi:MAG TPA: methyltransferase domain-containing protein [Fimbriiglobus sp.]|nr:methyltransferase domain-containing protein [Fimbriiglobus sp.]